MRWAFLICSIQDIYFEYVDESIKFSRISDWLGAWVLIELQDIWGMETGILLVVCWKNCSSFLSGKKRGGLHLNLKIWTFSLWMSFSLQFEFWKISYLRVAQKLRTESKEIWKKFFSSFFVFFSSKKIYNKLKKFFFEFRRFWKKLRVVKKAQKTVQRRKFPKVTVLHRLAVQKKRPQSSKISFPWGKKIGKIFQKVFFLKFLFRSRHLKIISNKIFFKNSLAFFFDDILIFHLDHWQDSEFEAMRNQDRSTAKYGICRLKNPDKPSKYFFFFIFFKNKEVFMIVSWLIVIESPMGVFVFEKFQLKKMFIFSFLWKIYFYLFKWRKCFLIKNTKIQGEESLFQNPSGKNWEIWEVRTILKPDNWPFHLELM